MLYILPPPRAPNPPSPWDSILCTAGSNSNDRSNNWSNHKNNTTVTNVNNKRPPPRVRLRNFSNKIERKVEKKETCRNVLRTFTSMHSSSFINSITSSIQRKLCQRLFGIRNSYTVNRVLDKTINEF
ncbi:hypothetical protein QE152_g38779 [Popillia japonica]|uniref:Uncharacterized protein n=1 Tax=Popillia japonica TaxID=7064 RepID=A0AAW1HVT2_POPJA